MRLIAIDGTDIALESSPALKEASGCSGPGKDAATALGSLAYGPLDHAIYDCQFAPYAADERDLAIKHMERLTELGLTGSLLLFDRWYPSPKPSLPIRRTPAFPSSYGCGKSGIWRLIESNPKGRRPSPTMVRYSRSVS